MPRPVAHRRLLLLLLGAGLAFTRPAGADWLRFKGGGNIRVDTTRQGDTIRITAPGGPWRFPASVFDEIRPEEDTAELDRRLADAWSKSAPGDRWPILAEALGRNRRELYAAWLDGSEPNADEDPRVTRCRKVLRNWKRGNKANSPRPVRAILPPNLREAGSEHAILLHQHADEPEIVRERLELVEDVAIGLAMMLAAQGSELAPPSQPLVSAYLRRRDEYLAVLHRQNANAFLGTRGFYHPTLKFVLAHDHRGRSGTPPAPSKDDRLRLLATLEHRSTDLGLLAHETIHQLTVATGLIPRVEALPRWLHEGLAMQFEAIQVDRWAGLARVSPYRHDDWQPFANDARMAPLLRDEGLQGGYNQGAYARSWAFVWFLRSEHPDSLVALLKLLPDQPGQSNAIVRQQLGQPIQAIETEWRTAMGKLRDSPAISR